MDSDPEGGLRDFLHDVRSPLNVVLGFAVMLEDELSGEEAESAAHIRRAAEQILELVDGLSDADSSVGGSSAGGRAAMPAAEPSGGSAPIDGDVVLIEDNASNVRLVERILAHRPQRRLTSLTRTVEVDEWLASGAASPHVVLLDRHLGRADGLDLIEAIRVVHPGVRVVVVTADATDVARDEALSAGADGVVTKPFSVAELLAVVDQASAPASGSKR